MIYSASWLLPENTVIVQFTAEAAKVAEKQQVTSDENHVTRLMSLDTFLRIVFSDNLYYIHCIFTFFNLRKSVSYFLVAAPALCREMPLLIYADCNALSTILYKFMLMIINSDVSCV